jgi:putative oxidoreductase
MEEVFLIGRILFAYLVIGSAFGHLTQTSMMAGYAESRGVPSAKLAVQVSGVGFLLGGLSILFGVWGDVGALCLALLLFSTAFLMHAFWRETDEMNKMMEMVQFNKDIALAGGALVMFSILSSDFAPYTMTGSLINW